MQNDPIVQQYYRLLNSIGKATLSNLYPNDFEYYMCSLELVDSDGRTVDFLIFPINPNQISEKKIYDSNIQRTASGIVTNDNETFLPVQINLSGNFGRKLKFLLGREGIDASAINFNGEAPKVFSNQIKTGYGTTKILESLLDNSRKTDRKGNQYKLYFYNQCYGTAYIVKVLEADFSQDMSSNMIWNYQISLLGIAPLNSETKSKGSMSLKEMCTKQIISKKINQTYTLVKSLIK